MCKKLIYLVSFVLVLDFTAGVTRAELRHHWQLDGNLADTVGSLELTSTGGTVFITGKHGGAVEFDGSGDYIYAELAVFMPSQTTCVWVKTDNTGQSILGWSGNHPTDGLHDRELYVNADGTVTVRVWTGVATTVTSQTLVDDGAWHHLATGYTEGGETWLYVDGVSQGSTPSSNIYNSYPTSYLTVGIESNVNSYLTGAVDDIRVYDEALSQGQVLGAMTGGAFPFAFGPVPKDGTLHEDTWISLSWRPGDMAVSHDVYLGDNFDDVNAGAESTFLGNQAVTNLIVGFPGFAYPDGLVPGTTYYWRIDEVNDTEPNSPWKGDVWSFWIPPYTAYNPNPADGVKFVDPDAELNWTAGFGAKLHTVYFGDNFDDVNNAVVGLPQSETNYTPDTLELEKVYYWRIDEFDGVNTYKGDVWSFSTIPNIAITDPSLVGWWKLDEDMGTTAVDWSGHGNHGTFQGDPQWVAGMLGGALDFDGNGDYVDCGNDAIFDITDAFTVAAWINLRSVPGDWRAIIAKGDDAWRMATWGTEQTMNFAWTGGDRGYQNAGSTTALAFNEWYHVCGVYSTADGGRIYINGIEEAFTADTEGVTTGTYPVYIGDNSQNTGRFWDGLIDDVRIYNKALTLDEIQQAMRGNPLLAWGPNPSNGSTPYIRDATPLSWSRGDNASQHDVYFGTDKGAVADVDASDTTGIYRGRQGVTIYTPSEGVEWGGGPYYWRVDEYNTDATISKGNVWSFTVADFIGIDDIEDYNDYPPDEIFSTWIDGWEVPTNGSLAGHAEPPFAETGNVHGGRQSMPVYYENNFKYSEITMTLVWPRDWTEEGVGVLSLWFYGDAANAAERMYVNLNGIATVYHNDPSAALIEEWMEWRIHLQEFAAQGVNLANVNTISIGFGDKNNLQAGGLGMVLFDDIRLYRPEL